MLEAAEGRSQEERKPAPDAIFSLLLSTRGVESFLDDLAQLAARIVEPPASCGITIRRDGQPITVASSDERANMVDESQYDHDQGPCLQAMRTGEVVEIVDQALDARWDEYRLRAIAAGVRCSLSLPLAVDGRGVGAMNIYGFERTHEFRADEQRDAEAFAAQATTALTLLVRQAHQAEEAAQLEQALASRTVIDQAIGILMAQQRCNAEEAFDLLRRHSQNHNIRLRDVAAGFVERASGSAPAPSHPFQRNRKN